ncbi:MAG: TerC family protein [Caulobacterales bacterium]
MDLLTGEVGAFVQVILIDLALAGDNAIVVGLAAAGLPPAQRKQAVLWGVGFALFCRIIFAIFTTQLLQVPGLLFVGGLALLWVGWKLSGELFKKQVEEELHAAGQITTMRAAIWHIAVADITMSIDNVLAVAGAARDHLTALVFGLLLSIVLMAVAANYIANLMKKYPWIKAIGVIVVFFVAAKMMWEGWHEVPPLFARLTGV